MCYIGEAGGKAVFLDVITVLYKNYFYTFPLPPGLDPDKHLGKTLDQMEPDLLEVSITYRILVQVKLQLKISIGRNSVKLT